MNNYMKLSLATTLLLPILPVQQVAAQEQRPNVIVFLVDDMGLMDTSLPFLCDEAGNPVRYPLNDWYRTPNMERLAEQGIRFSTFYAQSVSSPSRASIMTGQNGPTGLIRKATTARPMAQRTGTGRGLRSRPLLCPASCSWPVTRRFTWGRPILVPSVARERTR